MEVNGIVLYSEVYSCFIVANKPGTYRIGAATVITTKGKSFRTQPFTIKVKQAKRQANPLEGKAFVRMEVNKQKAVVGEQITLDYRIYTRVPIEQSQVLNYPSFEDAFVYDLNDYAEQAEIVTIDGEEFYTRSIRRTALFPNQAGKIIVEPVGFAVSVPVERTFSYMPYRLRQYKLFSDTVVLNVQQLDGAPMGYSGAIGQYKLQAHIDQTQLSSDDVVELVVRVEGTGNIRNVLPPKLEINKRYFDVFSPTINERLRIVNRMQGGVKTFEYVLTPKALGTFEIQPRLVVFDGEQRRFVTLDTTIVIEIKKGKTPLPTKAERDTARSASEVVAAETAAEALQYRAPLALSALQTTASNAFFGSLTFWLLLLLPLLLLAIYYGYSHYQQRYANQPEAERRRQTAASEASRRLQQAQQALTQNQPTAFYKEISKALLGFISDRYQLSQVELNKQNLQQHLQQQQVPRAQIEQLLTILETSDRALFAGLADTASMETIQRESQALIEHWQQ
jgi:hypothetical protein